MEGGHQNPKAMYNSHVFPRDLSLLFVANYKFAACTLGRQELEQSVEPRLRDSAEQLRQQAELELAPQFELKIVRRSGERERVLEHYLPVRDEAEQESAF